MCRNQRLLDLSVTVPPSLFPSIRRRESEREDERDDRAAHRHPLPRDVAHLRHHRTRARHPGPPGRYSNEGSKRIEIYI